MSNFNPKLKTKIAHNTEARHQSDHIAGFNHTFGWRLGHRLHHASRKHPGYGLNGTIPTARKIYRRTLIAYWSGSALVFLIAAAGSVLFTWRDYDSNFEAAAQNNMNLARALAEHTTLIFVKLEALANAVIEDRARPLVPREMLSQVLERRAMAEPAARAIALIDKSGRVYATSSSIHPLGQNLSQTNAYKLFSLPGGPSSHISRPYETQLAEKGDWNGWTMDYTHRIEDAAGRFDGYVLIEVDGPAIYGFYMKTREETGRVIGLVGEDGVIRVSNIREAIGANIKHSIEKIVAKDGGTQTATSFRTGLHRIFAYSKSSAAPLLAYVGTPTRTVLDAWRTTAAIVAAALSILCAALVAMGVMLGKYAKNQRALMRSGIEMERQRQEREFLEAILNTGGALVAVTDAAGRPVVVNPAFQEMFGSGPEPTSSCPPLQRALGRSLEDLIAHLPVETTVSRTDVHGRKRELSWTVTAIRDISGAIRNLVAIGFDNTERREAELAIYQSGKLITLGEMATGLAHEINQPLGTIVLTLDHLRARLAGKVEPNVIKEHIDLMMRQAERASNVVDHMRIYGRRTDGSACPLDPADAIDGALAIAGRQIEDAGIVLKKNYRSGDTLIVAEMTVVEQILINLLLNARDAMLQRREARGASSTDWISLSVAECGHGMVRLSVEDAGGGVPPEIIGRIFEPFFTTKPVGKGTGLGLALSYGMAKSLNGRLEVHNSDNGAVFSLLFPQAGHGIKTSQRAG